MSIPSLADSRRQPRRPLPYRILICTQAITLVCLIFTMVMYRIETRRNTEERKRNIDVEGTLRWIYDQKVKSMRRRLAAYENLDKAINTHGLKYLGEDDGNYLFAAKVVDTDTTHSSPSDVLLERLIDEKCHSRD